MEREALMRRLNEHLEAVRAEGYNPIYLALHGSQNYSLDYEGSDVDSKAIVMPSFEDIVFNKPMVSTTFVMPNEEHCDLKDIRLMFGNFKKQNINFLEILFTPFFLINEEFEEEVNRLRSMAEDIARYNPYRAVKCMSGMAMEKYKAMEHSTPLSIEKIEKFGYDPKQLHHIVRMREFMERYIKGESFQNCLISEHKEFLIRIKQGEIPLEEARKIAKAELEKVDALKENFEATHEDKEDKTVIEKMGKILLSAFSKQFNLNTVN